MGRKADLKVIRKSARAAGTDSEPRYTVKVSKADENGKPLDGTFVLANEHWKAKYKRAKKLLDGKRHDHGRARYAW